MSVTILAPYLILPGTAQQALALYQRALGAKVVDTKPMNAMPGLESAEGRLMHAHLTIDGRDLMLADTMPGAPSPTAGNVSVCLNYDDAAEMQRAFDGLAEGGSVAHPIDDTPWGARFGMLTDAYGIEWMLNFQKPGTP